MARIAFAVLIVMFSLPWWALVSIIIIGYPLFIVLAMATLEDLSGDNG